MLKDWKTTVGGLLAAIGLFLETVPDPAWMPYLGKALVMASIIFFGYNAADKGK
jgi:hypothetical protein